MDARFLLAAWQLAAHVESEERANELGGANLRRHRGVADAVGLVGAVVGKRALLATALVEVERLHVLCLRDQAIRVQVEVGCRRFCRRGVGGAPSPRCSGLSVQC